MIRRGRKKERRSAATLLKITNVWAGTVEQDGVWYSEAHIEANLEFPYFLEADGCRFKVRIPAAAPNLPVGSIPVRDGLVRSLRVSGDPARGTTVEVCLDYPVAGEAVWTRRMYPARLTVRFGRHPLRLLFGGRSIALDPGHGGSDAGHRGPVNLREKNVVLTTALKLEELLLRAGARVVMTRRGDEAVPDRDRLTLAAQAGAQVFISLHTHWSADPRVAGCAVHYNSSGAGLAGKVARALRAKARLRVRPPRLDPWLEGLGSVPGLLIETVTISNWVEEGLLRSAHFHRQLAQGIFNGLRDHLACPGEPAAGIPRTDASGKDV